MIIPKEQPDLVPILQDFSARLPYFPDGRIDYTDSPSALVLNCFVKYQGEILLLQRSDQVGTYRGVWNSVAGYIDEIVPIEEKILEELHEELGLNEETIKEIRIGKIYQFTDEEIDRTWIIVPCQAELAREVAITLDWEHVAYRWIAPEELASFPTVPHLDESYAQIA